LINYFVYHYSKTSLLWTDKSDLSRKVTLVAGLIFYTSVIEIIWDYLRATLIERWLHYRGDINCEVAVLPG